MTAPDASPNPPPAAPPRSKAAPIALGIALVLLAGVAVKRALDARPAGPTPGEQAGFVEPKGRGSKLADHGEIGAFALQDRLGQPFTRADLAGKVWVVDFVYTTCPGPCIPMTDTLRNLVQMLRDEPDVGFLSISVDPAADTPDVLRNFVRARGAESDRWRWLTGDPAVVNKLVRESFFERIPEKDASGQILHSTRFFVLDRAGHLRSIHNTQQRLPEDPDVKEEVVHAVKLLLRPPPAEDGAAPGEPAGR